MSFAAALILFSLITANADEHEDSHHMGMVDNKGTFPGKSVLTHEREEALGEIINAYLKIRKSLSRDSLNGVSVHARKIVEEADNASKKIKAMKTSHDMYTHKLHSLLDKTAKHARKLQGGGIEGVRKQFLALSTDIFDIVKNC